MRVYIYTIILLMSCCCATAYARMCSQANWNRSVELSREYLERVKELKAEYASLKTFHAAHPLVSVLYSEEDAVKRWTVKNADGQIAMAAAHRLAQQQQEFVRQALTTASVLEVKFQEFIPQWRKVAESCQEMEATVRYGRAMDNLKSNQKNLRVIHHLKANLVRLVEAYDGELAFIARSKQDYEKACDCKVK